MTRIIVWLSAAALIIWIIVDAPIIILGPVQPSSSVPAFKVTSQMIEATEALDEMHPYADATIAALDQAKRTKRLQEDPALKELRRDVLAAAKLLIRAPCDEDKHRALSKALTDLIEASEDGSDIEQVEIDGRMINGTPFLNEQSYRIFTAGALGQVLIADMFSRDYRSAIRQVDQPLILDDPDTRPEFYFECRRP
jgi:hypothetical protein